MAATRVVGAARPAPAGPPCAVRGRSRGRQGAAAVRPRPPPGRRGHARARRPPARLAAVPWTKPWTARWSSDAAARSRSWPRWPGRPAPTASTSPRSPPPMAGAATSGSGGASSATAARWWPPARRMRWGPGTLTQGGRHGHTRSSPPSRGPGATHGWPGPAPMPRGLRWARRVDSEGIPEGRRCRGRRRGGRAADGGSGSSTGTWATTTPSATGPTSTRRAACPCR